MSNPLPKWCKEPLIHIMLEDEDSLLKHQHTFAHGFVAAMRMTHATNEELERGWLYQAGHIFNIYLEQNEEPKT